MPLDPVYARRGRIAISALFLLNGAILGSWAPQIPLLLPRHGITEGALGLLIEATLAGEGVMLGWQHMVQAPLRDGRLLHAHQSPITAGRGNFLRCQSAAMQRLRGAVRRPSPFIFGVTSAQPLRCGSFPVVRHHFF